MTLRYRWVDGEREPRQPPNPAFPNGIDLDLSDGKTPTCSVKLPCPAPRCGYYVVECDKCGTRAVVTTAGRADDPRSFKVDCGERRERRMASGQAGEAD